MSSLSRFCVECGASFALAEKAHGAQPIRCLSCAEAKTYPRNSRGRLRRRKGSASQLAQLGCPVCGVVVPLELNPSLERRQLTMHPECAALKRREIDAVKHHRRRVAKSAGRDLTSGDVAELKMLARFCAACHVELAGDVGPTQKHLDHIVPLIIGGSHTRANVRVLCRTCNLARPKDGSDVTAAQVHADRERAASLVAAAERRRAAVIAGWETRKRAARVRREVLALRRIERAWRPGRVSRYAEVLPTVAQMRADGSGYKLIASRLGVSRDTARDLVRMVERIAA